MMRIKQQMTTMVLTTVVVCGLMGCVQQQGGVDQAIADASRRPDVKATEKAQATDPRLNQFQGKVAANAELFCGSQPIDLRFRQAAEGVVGETVALGQEGSTTQPAETGCEEIPLFRDILKRDVKALPGSLWEDTKAVYTDPKNLGILLVAGGASLTMRCSGVDDKWEDHFDKHRSFSEGWGDAAGFLGNPGTHFALAAAMYVYGVKAEKPKEYEVSKALFNALVINDLSTMFLKVAANTDSPNGEHLAWPSGHTSSSVVVAAVLDKYYGHWVGVPLYGVAALVGFERMDDGEHHFSDVLFGAALGYVVGKTVADGHAPEVCGGVILPYADPYRGSSGLVWVKDF
jgi:hypothetical protein